MNLSLHTLLSSLAAIIPLSYLGLWRWSVWATKRACGFFYRPKTPVSQPKHRRLKVSVVVPVYNEDPEILRLALDSWIKNGVNEIIAVIDASNRDLIYLYDRHYAPRKDVLCRLVVTPKPGKRAALADGMLLTSGDIISLIDSDAIWGDAILAKVLPYFNDQKVGGVTTQQRVLNPKTIPQVLFDIILWTRYHEEVPFLLGAGTSVNTLSGRTAFYRREALLGSKRDIVHDLTHEFYWKSRCISGDDKRLTHLVLEDGWNLEYAYNATIYTPGAKDFKTFLKQRLRWIRNSWRADTRAFQRKWVFRHPALALHNVDRFIQPFFMLIGPFAFILSLLYHRWAIAAIIVSWWFVSRFIKLFGYFRDHPTRILYLPAYILFSYWNSIVKIYAWATILEQGWITRWDSARLVLPKRLSFLQGAFVTMSVVFFIFAATLKYYSHAIGSDLSIASASTPGAKLTLPIMPAAEPNKPANAVFSDQLAKYIVVSGDTLTGVAAKLGVSVDELRNMNSIYNRNRLTVGEVIYSVAQNTAKPNLQAKTPTTPVPQTNPTAVSTNTATNLASHPIASSPSPTTTPETTQIHISPVSLKSNPSEPKPSPPIAQHIVVTPATNTPKIGIPPKQPMDSTITNPITPSISSPLEQARKRDELRRQIEQSIAKPNR